MPPSRPALSPEPAGIALAPTATLGASVAARVRERILNGEFAPGQRLSEATLADDLAISRNTLREAFRTLTHEGLLTHAPNRGVFVAVPSVASIIDIYRVRRLIECQALANAYPRHPAGRRMRAAVESAADCHDRADWQGVGTANMQFHRAIVELADSERLNALFGRLLIELRLAFGLLDDAEFLHAPYVPMNRSILELAEAGRFADASTALASYLAQSERVVLAVYGRRLGEAAPEG